MGEDRRRARPRADWTDDAKRRQNDYKKRERATIAADLPRETADRFKQYCAASGRSVSAVIAEYVRSVVGDDATGESTDGPTTSAADGQRPGTGRDDDQERPRTETSDRHDAL